MVHHSSPSRVAIVLSIASVLDATRAAPLWPVDPQGAAMGVLETEPKHEHSGEHHAETTHPSKPEKEKPTAHKESAPQHHTQSSSTNVHDLTHDSTHGPTKNKAAQPPPAFLVHPTQNMSTPGQSSKAIQSQSVPPSTTTSLAAMPASSTPTPSLSSSLSPETSATPTPTTEASSSSGLIAGIVAIFVLLLAGIIAFVCIRKRRRQASQAAARQAHPDPFTQGFGSHDLPPHTAYARPMSEMSMQVPSEPIGFFTVIQTYSPSLNDELDIQPGQQVEILKEYDDGWCYGRILGEDKKGVFPRHCVNRAATQAYQEGQDKARRMSSMRRQQNA